MAAKKKAAAVRRAGAASGSQDTVPEKWRILIFMATETASLIEPAKADLLELLTVRGGDAVRVYVQVHGFQVEPPQSQGSQRYTIKDGSLTRDCGNRMPPPPAVFARLAVDLAAKGFASAALEKFVKQHVHDLPPEETAGEQRIKVALVLWGHSQGVAEAIAGPPAASPFRARPLAYAGASSAEIVVRLREALRIDTKKVRSLDMLVFDSCFMGAAEVVAEFYDVAKYLVASQVTVELPALQLASVVEAAKCTAEPATLGHAIVSQASDTSSGVRSLTLFQPRKAWLVPPCTTVGKRVAPPGEPFLELAKALHRGVRHAALACRVFEAFHDAPFREVRQFLDLRRLTWLLARVNPNHHDDPQIGMAARNLHDALHPAPDGFIVEVCEREDRARFGGVSVYCPWFTASRAQLRAGMGDAVVDFREYLKLQLVAGCDEGDRPPDDSWGHLMLGLAHAWRLGRADGAADGTDGCQCHCPCCGRTPDGAAVGPDVRTGGPKEPKLGPIDDDIA